MKPVYMINGFLESGKTEFICYTIEQPYFQIKGRTLLIVCEEGEGEYGEKLLQMSRTDMVLIEDEEDFNTSHLIELEKRYKPERQKYEASLPLEHRAADYHNRCFHISYVFYQYEISFGGDAA